MRGDLLGSNSLIKSFKVAVVVENKGILLGVIGMHVARAHGLHLVLVVCLSISGLIFGSRSENEIYKEIIKLDD